MKTISLTILPDGTVCGLYTEAIDLSSFGQLRIERLTNIEFDNEIQLWCVFDLNGNCFYSSPSREECLKWEQDYFADLGG